MPLSKIKNDRVSWGKNYQNLPSLDLLSIQKESYQWFLTEGINQALAEISPVIDFTGKNWELHFGKHSFGKIKRTIFEAISKGLTYDCPLKVEVVLVNKQTGRETKKEVFLGDIPQMTPNGTFVVNGIERGVVNQIVRSPGVFFSGDVDPVTSRMLYRAEIRPIHGSWLEFMMGRNNLLSVRIDRRRKFPVTTLLRVFGLSTDEQILEAFPQEEAKDFLLSTLEKDPTKAQSEALTEIYQKMRPGEPVVLENAQALIDNMFFNPRRYQLSQVGRYKINKRLGIDIPNVKENWVLTVKDVVETVRYLIGLQSGKGVVDDIDHLSNRRIRQVGELVAESAFRIGLLRLERSIKEKMSLFAADQKISPVQLVNARPIIAAINEFFRTNQLSTILDQTNPLSELDNLRRVSVMGSGGITRERASFSIRDINSSQYGRICPIRSPEGPNIGLVTYLALYARINKFGFLESPYRKVEKIKIGSQTKMKVSHEVIYLQADDEQAHYVTHCGVNLDKNGFIIDSWVPVRFKGEFLEVPTEKVEYIDVIPRQVVGVSASLIPFLAHDMPNRALMGANMECQSVPLINPRAPIVGTGLEKVIPQAMGRVVYAYKDDKVVWADAEKIILGSGETHYLSKFRRTNPNSTCYSQKLMVKAGQRVKKGDLLIDGPSCEGGELALGRNLLIAYCSMGGQEFEDAVVISDRLVKEDVLTSINIEEYEALIVETKLGPEELTRDIPNVSESDLAHLAEDGIVVIGSDVGPNDILVGKIAPKGQTELTAEERLLRAIFGEKAKEVKDTSLRMPHGEWGTVIEVQILDREKGDELEVGTIKKVIVKVAQLRKITVGDKLAGRHGNKGVISKIMPQADMPYLEDGTAVDIVISPLSVLSRMNLGQLFEAHLGWAAQKLGYKVIFPAFEKFSEKAMMAEMEKAGLPANGKVTLYDGRTSEPKKEKSVVGIAYIMKLVHMVEDKVHARSTGPYSLVTQQPLGGKAQMGGQRLGEMEVWALEAHRAAHVLQEMLTIKSDDVVGRAKAFEAIVRGTEIPQPTVPESFKVLVKELNSLALEVTPVGLVEEKNEEEQKEKQIVDFSALKIKLASPETIKSWSFGEVLKPETINYRTLKTEKDGLFCERIFGPTKDWECYCGKYKRIRYRGIICDKCGVEVTQSKVRRERMGHIALASPVAHVWFFKGSSSKLALLLDLPPKSLEAVIYFAQYLVTEVNKEEKKKTLMMLEEDLAKRKKELKEKLEKAIIEAKKAGEREEKETRGRIKNKEQQILALSEIRLKTRQKIQSLKDSFVLEIQEVEEIYRLISELVRNLKEYSLLTEDEYLKLSEYQASSFLKVGMGAEVILEAIKKLDLDKLVAFLRKEAKEASAGRALKAAKRLRLIEGLRRGGVEPSWMILEILPVIPPDLRPMVQLSGGKFATSDLNDLYRRVINRNSRLKHLMVLGAPNIIVRNEKRMLQEAVDSLIDALKGASRRFGRQAKPLRSLSDMLRGKQGRFRQNLLGKRVDYSGRSVIVVGPELKLTQCGLPKEMALEMFKPFVLREIILSGIAPNVKSAKYVLEHRPPEVFDVLEKITSSHPVLLNRAPTLHKLGIQAFYPILIEGSAIKIHPCVCAGYNADFDGDQMAIHVPLGGEAKNESVKLMISQNNLLRPADGSPITIPDKEMALGCYFMTSFDSSAAVYPVVFSEPKEAIFAYQLGKINLRQPIKIRVEKEIIETSVGRLLFNEILPSGIAFINDSVRQQMIKGLVTRAIEVCESETVVKLIDDLKDLGFWSSTISGLSVGAWDCETFSQKEKIIHQANENAAQIEDNFTQGLITAPERRRLIQEIWMDTTEILAEKTWEQFKEENSVHLIVSAGLRRTSKDQVKQLSAMQGLVVDPLGKIVELPIKSNFKEGLSVFEYLTSARGARKGLTDTAIKTSDAGYLTRRLVDAAHDVIIRVEDCKTKNGLKISRTGKRAEKFLNRVLGRVLAKEVKDPKTHKILLKSGELITEANLELLEKYHLEEVSVRSPLTCESQYGICVRCYGRDLSTSKMVEIGVPVGVIAAQSIGEPGTQLTLRTKQTGGIIGLDVTQGLPRVEELFEVRIPKTLSPLAEIAGKIELIESDEGQKVRIRSVGVKPAQEREYSIPAISQLRVKEGELVEVGAQLASGALDIKEILAVRGLQAAQEYLLEEVQAVYESQGIPISDKHLEVIIRKMSDKVRIETVGVTTFLPGDLVTKTRLEEENARVLKEKGEPATAKTVILGLSRTSFYTDSWLSAASFEETTNVLTEVSLENREDRFLGLKENVIIGRLIPVTPERAKIEAKA
jgi:DNA-directed RNA polymerase beta' subunit